MVVKLQAAMIFVNEGGLHELLVGLLPRHGLAGHVRRVAQLGIAGEYRSLSGEPVGRLLIADDGVGGAFALALVHAATLDPGALEGELAPVKPQPEIHIRADRDALFQSVGRVLYAIQRGGIVKVGFITQPDAASLAESIANSAQTR